MVITRAQSLKIKHLKSVVESFIDKSREISEPLDPIAFEILNKHFESYKDEIDRISEIQDQEEYIIEDFVRIQTSINELTIIQRKTNNQLMAHSTPIENSIQNHIKIPKLKIHNFSGDPNEWHHFWTIFERNIHHNSSLNNHERFCYLLGFLDPKPKNCLIGIPICEETYEKAIETLKLRYGNKNELIKSHYIKLSYIRKAKNIDDFIKIHSLIEQELMFLENLGENIEQNSLITQLIEKIPNDVLIKFKEDNNRENFDIKSLRDIMNKFCNLRKDNSIPSLTNTKFNKENYQFKTACAFCNENHFSDECKKFKTIEERISVLGAACRNCLKNGHQKSDCRRIKPCFHCRRSKDHHPSLCKFRERSNNRTSAQRESAMIIANHQTLMPVIKVKISSINNPSITHEANVLIDTGSFRSYIREDIITKFGLKIPKTEKLMVDTFNSKNSKCIMSGCTNLYIYTNCTPLKIKVNTVDQICNLNINNLTYNNIIKTYNLEDKFPLKCSQEVINIDLIIGSDSCWEIIESIIKVDRSIYVLKTKCGEILTGKYQILNQNHDSNPSLACLDQISFSVNDFANFNLDHLWNLENIGILENPIKNDDELVQSYFDETVSFKNNRYSVSLPWKRSKNLLSNNFKICFSRLSKLYRKLLLNKEHLIEYDNTIRTQLSNDIIEEIKNFNQNEIAHYIPHRHIIKSENNTTKFRIVYDASSKASKCELSLNDCLYKGNLKYTNLTGILLRFRTYKYVVTSDIEKAFLQISINLDDRNYLRFIWINDINSNYIEKNIKIYRFKRLPFGLTCSPYLLEASIMHHLKKQTDIHSKKLINNIYVDNVVLGYDTSEEVKECYETLKNIFNEAKMNLREWNSNCNRVRTYFKADDFSNKTICNILGIHWNSNNDNLFIQNSSKLDPQINSTKRNIAHSVGKLFDPLGLFSPCILGLKRLLRKCWIDNLDWDSEVKTELNDEWKKICIDLSLIPTHPIPRFIGSIHDSCIFPFKIICFTDSSCFCYACTIYLVNQVNGKLNSNLIFTKSKLCPKENITIPKLELLACLIGVRSCNFIINELSIKKESVLILTDSRCVLDWIFTQKELPTFVQRRIHEIKKAENFTWAHTSGSVNPADIASRGMSFVDLKMNKMWWNGPEWIEANQLFNNKLIKIYGKILIEDNLRAEKTLLKENNLILINNCNNYELLLDLSKTNKYNLSKVINITSWIMRFINNCKNVKIKNELTNKEKSDAKILLISLSQRFFFSNILSCLKSKIKNNLCIQNNLFLDSNNLIRSKTRLNELFDFETSNPILLSSKSSLAYLIIKNYHHKIHHGGINETLAEIRKEFFIPKCRAITKSIIKYCDICSIRNLRQFSYPDCPALPISRLEKVPPFTNIGIDYTGPINIKINNNKAKIWIVIFTCMVTRAIHLEYVKNMSTITFINSFRRFSSRRGSPKIIYSDNAKYFLTASREIKDVTWKFVTAYSPWKGGFYERLIKNVKNSLKCLLFNRIVEEDQFNTTLCEVENIINQRPLMQINEDNNEFILRPALFLSNNNLFNTLRLKSDGCYEIPVNSNLKIELEKNYRFGKRLTEMFWKRFYEEYLPSLKSFKNNNENIYNPRINQTVLLRDELIQGKWKVAKIIDLNPSDDGLIRSVKLKLENGRTSSRPVSKLVPLELELDLPNVKELTESLIKANNNER